MKTITALSLSALLLASCQKESILPQKQISTVSTDNNEISQDDIITFLDSHGRLIGLSDYGADSKTYVNNRAFTISSDADSAFPKRFTIKLIKSETVQVKSIIIYLDGRAIVRRDAATAPIDKDTVMFKIVEPRHKGIAIVNPHDYYGRHFICMRLIGAAGNTGSYEMDITDFTFLNKADQPQTIFKVENTALLLGDVVNYVN